MQCYMVPYGVPNACIMWILPKFLRLLPLFNWNRIKDHNYWIRNLGVDLTNGGTLESSDIFQSVTISRQQGSWL